ncbi:flagellar motor switch protein FliN [Microbacteriaceae bacterium 4G12]
MQINENIPLTIYFELGRTKKRIDDLLHITKGTLYRLEDSEKNMVRIMLENQEIGLGKILTKNGKMYVEITKLKENE